MTVRPLSRDEVRGLDARAEALGLPTLVLMENAGRGAAAWLRARGVAPASRGLIVCGPGNNGGDGGVAARHLDAWGYGVRVVWCARVEQLRGDAAVQWNILAKSGVDQSAWDHAESPDALAGLVAGTDLVIDALLGTGLSRPVEGPLRAAIELLNRSGKPVLALDLPSGLDADTGQPLGAAVRARATATFVAPKRGFQAPGASDYTGEVAVIDIGLPRRLLEPFQVS